VKFKQAQIGRLILRNETLRKQIAAAIERGMDGFDEDRFLKPRFPK
jgi:hypothetical protein